MQDICNFLPKFNDGDYFNIINTVYESSCPKSCEMKVSATYKMYIITDGRGVLRNESGVTPIKKGDVIVMPPSRRYAIEDVCDLSYIYASYLGVRAGILAENYGIRGCGTVFPGYEKLLPMWLSMINKKMKNASVCCEGVILYTFSEIGDTSDTEDQEHTPDNVAYRIKEYVEKHLTDHELRLEKIAASLNYTPKYVSFAFRRKFNININKYIRALRIQHACSLIDQGLSSVRDISSLSGYSDPLYFSTVFKSEIGASPREYINQGAKRDAQNDSDCDG